MKNATAFLKGTYHLLILALLSLATFFIVSQFKKCNRASAQDLALEQTPLIIENIEAIAKIATLTYREEFVVDSIEYYKTPNDRIAGELDKLFSQGDLKNVLKNGNIDRRLTLITTVDAQIGFDLKDLKQSIRNKDTLLIKVPIPQILHIGIDYRASEVFIEIGKWTDNERKQLEQKSMQNAINKFKNNKNYNASKQNFESLIRSSIPSKICIFEYDANN